LQLIEHEDVDETGTVAKNTGKQLIRVR